MKVLKSGDGRKGWSLKKTCTGAGNKNGGCGAELLIEEGDLFQTTSQCRDETDTYVTFKCSECGVLTDLSSSEQPPSHIREKLQVRNPGQPSSRDARD